MIRKVAILGSTGSIGKSLLKIINKNKKSFKIVLLTANKNNKVLLKQAIKFKVKNLIITNKKSYLKIKSMKLKKINLYNNFDSLKQIFSNKVDYTMSAITGLDGLKPTFNMIKFSKQIAIANKESLVCAWNLINNELKKSKTKFIPVDSEHFSVWFSLNNNLTSRIERIYLTASGGPFLNKPLSNFNKINISDSLKHPNWKMGKKITIDSSTLMNKVFEIIEARNIFNISLKKLSILTHPKSYIHALIKFNNGLIKIIAHDTTMDIPIFNTLYNNRIKNIRSRPLDIKKLNNLMLQQVDKKKFPLINVLKKINDNISLYETVIVSTNDEIVNMYLNGRIKYSDISKKILTFINNKEFLIYKQIKPKKIEEIIELNKYVRLKINSKVI